MKPGPVLRDIHLPAEPAWWPPAPGWWLVAALALVLLGWGLLALRTRLRRRRRLQRIEALAADAGRRFPDPAQGAELAAELSQLLRRAARLADPPAVALRGEAWLQWLDAGDPGAPFSRGPGRLLLEAPYRGELPRSAVEPLVPLVRTQLRRIAERARA